MSTFKRIAQVTVDEAIDAVDNVHTFLSINFKSESAEEESQSIPRQMQKEAQSCTHLPVWNV
jgi:hypothetical protein